MKCLMVWLLLATILQVAWLKIQNKHCPKPCDCTWKDGKPTIQCKGKNMTSLPKVLEVEHPYLVLSMDFNDLSLIKENQFSNSGYVQIQRLSMSNCSLRSFRPSVFSGLINLREIDLSNNLIPILIAHQFSALPMLRSLDLSSNLISSIHEESFSMIGGNIERVDLSDNMLLTLSVAVLNPLSSLKSLLLSGNMWNCNCELGELNSMLNEKNVETGIVDCSKPNSLSQKEWRIMHPSDFTCAPKLSLSLVNGSSLDDNNMTKLSCEVMSNPLSRIFWKKNGIVLNGLVNDIVTFEEWSSNSTLKSSRSELSFDWSDESIDTLECFAVNSVGDAKEVFSFNVSKIGLVLKDGDISVLIIIVLALMVTLMVGIIFVCCWRIRQKQQKGMDHSKSINLLIKPKELLSPGELSRSSTNDTFLSEMSDNNSDVTYLGVKNPCDSFEDNKSMRESEEWLSHYSNSSGCRSSLGNSSTFAQFYGSLRRPYYSHYTDTSDCHVIHSMNYCTHRPGYVTLPRRPRLNLPPTLLRVEDSLGPRTSADGSSHTNIDLLPFSSSKGSQGETSVHSPEPCSPMKTPINVVGLPSNSMLRKAESRSLSSTSNLNEMSDSVCSSKHLVAIPEQI